MSRNRKPVIVDTQIRKLTDTHSHVYVELSNGKAYECKWAGQPEEHQVWEAFEEDRESGNLSKNWD